MLDMAKSGMRRIVIDTNVLVASSYNRTSASFRILDAVRRGEFQLIVSPDIQPEYDRIMPRAVRTPSRIEHLRAIIGAGVQVTPRMNPAVTEDREDDKFLAAASAGSAEAVITNDPHLLRTDGYHGIRVLRPSAFERQTEPAEQSAKAQYTPRQGQFLAFIYYYTKIHRNPPAEADMAAYFGVSPPSIHQAVLTLEKHGFISRTPGQGRSIRVLLSRQDLPDLE